MSKKPVIRKSPAPRPKRAKMAPITDQSALPPFDAEAFASTLRSGTDVQAEFAQLRTAVTGKLVKTSRQHYWQAVGMIYDLSLVVRGWSQAEQRELLQEISGAKLKGRTNQDAVLLRAAIAYPKQANKRSGEKQTARDAGALAWARREGVQPGAFAQAAKSGKGLEAMARREGEAKAAARGLSDPRPRSSKPLLSPPAPASVQPSLTWTGDLAGQLAKHLKRPQMVVLLVAVNPGSRETIVEQVCLPSHPKIDSLDWEQACAAIQGDILVPTRLEDDDQ